MENNGLVEYLEERDEKMKAEGLSEGMQKGENVGKNKGIASSVKNLMKNMNWSFDNAANVLGIPQSERETIRSLVL